jgi:hypothetical protein
MNLHIYQYYDTNLLHNFDLQYIERMYLEDKMYFRDLGFHYSQAENWRKTYQYYTRAASDILLSERGNIGIFMFICIFINIYTYYICMY